MGNFKLLAAEKLIYLLAITLLKQDYSCSVMLVNIVSEINAKILRLTGEKWLPEEYGTHMAWR